MRPFFEKLTDFLEEEITPIANALDEDVKLFAEVYPRFVKLGGLNLLVPEALGGLGGGRDAWIEYNILMAQYSGALLFLQAQHQFCISRLKLLLPDKKVEESLRCFVREGRGMGLALAKNKKNLSVEKEADGYRLSGMLRWCTGKNYFSHLLISFEYEGVLFYTLLPFQERAGEAGSISIGPKIETAVYNSVPSNSITLDRCLILKRELLASHALKPLPPVEHPTIYNFAGVAKALLKIISQSTYGGFAEVQQKQVLLEQEWKGYCACIRRGSDNPCGLRREGLQLVEECILLARISCGSSGILRSHPLGRLIRESWQYTVAGYSEVQMRVYLSEESQKQSS